MTRDIQVFQELELREAIAHAAKGGIAIHLHGIVFDKSPACFKRDVAAGLPIAHVFCNDEGKLRKLVKHYGVRVVVIDRRGTDSQHVDMCGKPLRRLLADLGEDIERYIEHYKGRQIL